jgi:N-acyl-D-amino-acid deacylase
MNYDLVIQGGFIVDGSGCQAFRADVGISNSKIARIGSIDPENGTSLIEAQGHVLAPGFIDIHSHSDITLIVNPKAESKVRQGVTTEVVGNCGGSAAPLRGFAIDQEAKRYGVKAD